MLKNKNDLSAEVAWTTFLKRNKIPSFIELSQTLP
jgi:hypothetical protein